MTCKTIKIDDVEYVRADMLPKQSDVNVKIVVLDRGFVYVGDVEISPDKYFCTIRNARNIRIWGTTKGLGELVSGPTPKTVHDIVGTVQAPMRAVICIIDVEVGKWSNI